MNHTSRFQELKHAAGSFARKPEHPRKILLAGPGEENLRSLPLPTGAKTQNPLQTIQKTASPFQVILAGKALCETNPERP